MKPTSQPDVTDGHDETQTAVSNEPSCVPLINKIALAIMAVTAIWITGRGEWINSHEPDAMSGFDRLSFILQFLCWCYLGMRMIWLLFYETFNPSNVAGEQPRN